MQTASPEITTRPYGHAIVIGGSIAGLLAARVLSEIGAGVLAQSIRAHHEAIGAGLEGFAQRFQTSLSEAIAGAWQMAANEDQRWIDLRDQQPSDPAAALMQRYMGQVLHASLTVPSVAEAFFGVLQMVVPPTEFFRPDIVLQVMATLPEAH